MASKPHEQLVVLAKDIREGHVFTDRHLRDPNDLQMVFMVFFFMDKEQIDRIGQDPPGLIYEYMDQAGPRSINGYPNFFSAKMLNRDDTKLVFSMIEALDNSEKVVLGALLTTKPEEDSHSYEKPTSS